MERYTNEQRILIVKLFYQNGESFAATVRKLRSIWGHNNAPKESTVKRLMDKFAETGSVSDVKTTTRLRPGRSTENVAAVRDDVAQTPSTSIRHRAQQIGVSKSTMQRILTKDLHLHAYKVQLTQELKPADHGQRREFVNWVLERQHENADFADKIIFSDEAHFHLDGFVNRQNCRIWGEENPRVIHEKQMHPQRVTVWCGFWAGGIIGPFFYENEAGQAQTVNGVRYREMITSFFLPRIEEMNVEGMWFQQDGATCHTARETIQLLHQSFPGRVISRFGDQNWPPRSCDLTPLDFFLWGFLKSMVYANKPTTTQALKEEIGRCINEIPQHLCKKVIENFIKRSRVCQQSRGGHLHDILFHT